MNDPQEHNIRLTVDHRQQAINSAMRAECRLPAVNPLVDPLDAKDRATVEAADQPDVASL
jgi:hypothetical protein